ncbi:hypothetical protein MHYP_G00252510 [Metynnis hypsauchen]
MARCVREGLFSEGLMFCGLWRSAVADPGCGCDWQVIEAPAGALCRRNSVIRPKMPFRSKSMTDLRFRDFAPSVMTCGFCVTRPQHRIPLLVNLWRLIVGQTGGLKVRGHWDLVYRATRQAVLSEVQDYS